MNKLKKAGKFLLMTLSFFIVFATIDLIGKTPIDLAKLSFSSLLASVAFYVFDKLEEIYRRRNG